MLRDRPRRCEWRALHLGHPLLVRRPSAERPTGSADDTAQINLDHCIGCGVCAVTCDVDAIRMVRKDKDREFVPQKDYTSAMMDIFQERRADTQKITK